MGHFERTHHISDPTTLLAALGCDHTVRCPILLFVRFVPWFCGITIQFLTLKMTETEILPKNLSQWRQCFIKI